MKWFRVEADVVRHPKTRVLADTLGIPVHQAVGLLACLWCWACSESESGLMKLTGEELAAVMSWDGDPDRLISGLLFSGFLDRREDGLLEIHDWRERQPLLKARERVRRHRAKKLESLESADDIPEAACASASPCNVTPRDLPVTLHEADFPLSSPLFPSPLLPPLINPPNNPPPNHPSSLPENAKTTNRFWEVERFQAACVRRGSVRGEHPTLGRGVHSEMTNLQDSQKTLFPDLENEKIPSKGKDRKPKKLKIPSSRVIVDLWAKYCLHLPQPKGDVLRGERLRAWKARCLEPDYLENLETLIRRIGNSRFCAGQNSTNWIATIDYPLRASKWRGALERWGRGDDARDGSGPGSGSGSGEEHYSPRPTVHDLPRNRPRNRPRGDRKP